MAEIIHNCAPVRKLTARELAVVRYVWSLSLEEKKLLNMCFYRDATAAQLADMLDGGQGKIVLQYTAFHPIWEGNSMDLLKEDSTVELSFRANFLSNLRIVLLKVRT